MSHPSIALHCTVHACTCIMYLEAGHGSLAACSLVLHHATHGAPQDARGSAEVDGALLGVSVHALATELGVLDLVAVH